MEGLCAMAAATYPGHRILRASLCIASILLGVGTRNFILYYTIEYIDIYIYRNENFHEFTNLTHHSYFPKTLLVLLVLLLLLKIMKPGYLKAQLHKLGWLLIASSSSKSSKQEPTHLFLDGGKACVPASAHYEFLTLYVNAIAAGDPCCAVEVKTKPVFQLFMDWDIASETVPPPPVLMEAFEQARTAAVDFWDVVDEKCRLVVLAADTKTVANGKVKSGFHLVFEDVWTDAETAMKFRGFLAPRLMQEVGWEWAEALDAAVYKGSGLRMPWSSKSPTEHRPYIPFVEVTTCGAKPLDPIRGVPSMREWVTRLAIRAPTSSPFPPRTALKAAGRSNQPSMDPCDSEFGSGGGGVHASLAAYEHALPSILGALPEVYTKNGGVNFTGVYIPHHGCSVMFRTSSKFCMNVDREHTSSTVYFEVRKDGVRQRCYCRKESTHDCAHYSSELWPLPPSVTTAILPKGPSIMGGGGASSSSAKPGDDRMYRPVKRPIDIDALLRMADPKPKKKTTSTKKSWKKK
jgi:hypothetical protein